jgi:hypothetical protein
MQGTLAEYAGVMGLAYSFDHYAVASMQWIGIIRNSTTKRS